MMGKRMIRTICLICALIIAPAFLWPDTGFVCAAQKKPLVAIDAGHQAHANLHLERMDPDKKAKKYKVTGGTRGVATGVPEYKLNLVIAKKLKKELIRRGYRVYMVRTKNHVNISNKKRAKRVNKRKADVYIRLHADAAGRSAHGASVLCKSKHNSHATKKIIRKSKRLSKLVLSSYCRKTGAKKRGISYRNDLTGSNWSKVPTTLIEMGFMTNPREDRKMQKPKYQKKMVKGIANGIDRYFKR